MSVTFITKPYTCQACGYENKQICSIKYSAEVESEYPIGSKPEIIKPDGIYIELLNRDSFGIITSRIASEVPCPTCKEYSLQATLVDNYQPVLNFYPQTEAHKWLDGMAKIGL